MKISAIELPQDKVSDLAYKDVVKKTNNTQSIESHKPSIDFTIIEQASADIDHSKQLEMLALAVNSNSSFFMISAAS